MTIFGRQRKEKFDKPLSIFFFFGLDTGRVIMLKTELRRSCFREMVFHFNVLNMRYRKISIWQLEVLGSA